MKYFVTAIGTDSGKTVVSAILCKALQADYWKPIQAGSPTDSEIIRTLLDTEKCTTIHPEKYVLKTPASPHAAAALEGITISVNDFIAPQHQKDLVIEGAGGCLVPINNNEFVIDLAAKFQAEIILVSNFYLGSINHSLLSFEALKSRNLPFKGIIFNGPHNEESERIILRHTGLRRLLHIAQEKIINTSTIEKYSKELMQNWYG
jgi:dethiobiotin synthetase